MVTEDLGSMRGQLMGFYRGVIADAKASHRDKIRAARGIVEICGLAAPQQLQVSAAVVTSQADIAQLDFAAIAAVQHRLAGVNPLPAAELAAVDVQAMIADATPITPINESEATQGDLPQVPGASDAT